MFIEMVYDFGTICHTLTSINAHRAFDSFSNKRDKIVGSVSNVSGPNSLSDIHSFASAWQSRHLRYIHPHHSSYGKYRLMALDQNLASHSSQPCAAISLPYDSLILCSRYIGRYEEISTFKGPLPSAAVSPSKSSPRHRPSMLSLPPSSPFTRTSVAFDTRRRFRHIIFMLIAITVWLSGCVHCDDWPSISSSKSMPTTSMASITSHQMSNDTIAQSIQPQHISSIDSKQNESNMGMSGTPAVSINVQLSPAHDTNQTVDSELFDISIVQHSESMKSNSSFNGSADDGGNAIIVETNSSQMAHQQLVERIRKYQYTVDAKNHTNSLVPLNRNRQIQLRLKLRKTNSPFATSPLKRLIYVLTSIQSNPNASVEPYPSDAIQFFWRNWISMLMRNVTTSTHDHSEMVLDAETSNSSMPIIDAIVQNKIILWNFTKNIKQFIHRLTIDNVHGIQHEHNRIRATNTTVTSLSVPSFDHLITAAQSSQPTDKRNMPSAISYTDGNAYDGQFIGAALKFNIQIRPNLNDAIARISSVCLNCTYRIRPPVRIIILPKSIEARPLQQQPGAVPSLWPPLSVLLEHKRRSLSRRTKSAQIPNTSQNMQDSIRSIVNANRSQWSHAYTHSNALFNILQRSVATIPNVSLRQLSTNLNMSSLKSLAKQPQQSYASSSDDIKMTIPINYINNINDNSSSSKNSSYAIKFDNFNSINNFMDYAIDMKNTKQRNTYDFSNTKSLNDNKSIDNEITTYYDDDVDYVSNNADDIRATNRHNSLPSSVATRNTNSDTSNAMLETRPYTERISTAEPISFPISSGHQRKTQKSKRTPNETTASKPKSINSHLMRLESIKYQILMKLGLKQRPNITRTLSWDVVMSAISRADGTDQRININDKPDERPYPYQHRSMNNDTNDNDINVDNNGQSNDIAYSDSDDLYGQTREIILFAERGTNFNHQPLIEFVLANELNSKSNTKFSTKIGKNQVVTSADQQSSSKRTKCKDNRNKQHQLSKRKRRRRSSPKNTTASATNKYNNQPYNLVVETMANIELQPLVLVSNKRQMLKETLQKSSTNDQLDNGKHEDRSNNEVFDVEHNVHVRHAMLWIKVDANKNMARKHMKLAKKQRPKLWVFRINEQSSNKNSSQPNKVIASKNLNLSRLGWQKLDITSTVRQWYAHGGKSRLRFLVDCSGCTKRIRIHLFDDNHLSSDSPLSNRDKPNLRAGKFGSSNLSRPFLVIYTNPHVIKRVRRHTPDCSVAVDGQCCKQKFFVSFRELGWEDWIIAPHGYYANYCQGSCNGFRTPDNMQSYHSHVIEEYRKMNRLTGMQPCCTPLRFSSMSLIYYEDDTRIIKRDLPKMVVDECGCP